LLILAGLSKFFGYFFFANDPIDPYQDLHHCSLYCVFAFLVFCYGPSSLSVALVAYVVRVVLVEYYGCFFAGEDFAAVVTGFFSFYFFAHTIPLPSGYCVFAYKGIHV
jgi:hypothetical protein